MKKNMLKQVFGSRLVTKRKISAQQFLEESRVGKVSGARFVPPKIGEEGFGHFEADRKKPRYEVILD